MAISSPFLAEEPLPEAGSELVSAIPLLLTNTEGIDDRQDDKAENGGESQTEDER